MSSSKHISFVIGLTIANLICSGWAIYSVNSIESKNAVPVIEIHMENITQKCEVETSCFEKRIDSWKEAHEQEDWAGFSL